MPDSKDVQLEASYLTEGRLKEMSNKLTDLAEKLHEMGFDDFEIVEMMEIDGVVVGPVMFCTKEDLVQVRFWVNEGNYYVGCPCADGNWATLVSDNLQTASESVKIIITAAEEGKIKAEAAAIHGELEKNLSEN